MGAEKTRSSFFLGIFLMLFAMCCFTVLNAVVKEKVSDFHPIQIAFFRFIFATIPVSLLMIISRKASFSSISLWSLHIKRGALLAISYPCIYLAIMRLSLSTGVAIYFTATFFIILLSYPLLKERVTFRQWLSVIFGFLGVLIIVQPGSDTFEWATLCVVIAALTESAFNLYGRLLSATHDNLALTFLGSLIPAFFLLPLLPFIWQMPDLGGWGTLLTLGIMGGTGQICVTYAYSLVPAGILAPMIYSSIIWSGLCDILLFGLYPSVSLMIGCSIIIFSGFFVLWSNKS